MTEPRILLVEDEEYRRTWFRSVNIGVVMDVTHDVEEAKRLLSVNEYTQIFLDHDLSLEHYKVWEHGLTDHDATTGYVVADFLAANTHLSVDAEIIVHSMNPIGRQRMVARMKEGGRNAIELSFPLLQKAVQNP